MQILEVYMHTIRKMAVDGGCCMPFRGYFDEVVGMRTWIAI
jgi:hypothetical protein